MIKKKKLKLLRKLRKDRDEVLRTDNEGRAHHLLYNMPGVKRVTIEHRFGDDPMCEVQFYNGFEFRSYGRFTTIEAMQKIVLRVYLQAANSI